jgi:hypothetical protein
MTLISVTATAHPQVSSVLFCTVIYVVALVTGGIVMSFEMLGSRYLNPYFGNGIYTWAALISTVLAAFIRQAAREVPAHPLPAGNATTRFHQRNLVWTAWTLAAHAKPREQKRRGVAT